MKRTLALLAAAGALSVLVARTFTLDDDPIRSLTHPDPDLAALFDRLQSNSPFRGRIFLETVALTSAERDALALTVRDAGYREASLLAMPSPTQLIELAPMLPAEDLRALWTDGAIRARANEALSIAALPGGDAYLATLEADPGGLSGAVAARLLGGGGSSRAVRPMHVFTSPVPLDYERVGEVYDALVAHGDRVHFIGTDFFAVENYRAVRRDILVCSTLTFVLNLAVFLLFRARWALLGVLFVGTIVSYLTGLLAIRAFYAEIFAVVLAYTSTFVGFNNEALVHLAGIDEERRHRTLLGIWSAIGTTVIGFLVLLLGRSVMVRQMALASLGGTAGFLLVLFVYRRVLRDVTFRGFAWPKLTVRPAAIAAFCAACAAAIALVGVPRVETRIEEFRFQTPVLDAQVAHFSKALDALALENVVAVPVAAAGGPGAALAELGARGLLDPARHPLARWRPPEAQQETLRVLREEYPAAAERLRQRLEETGLRVQPAPLAGALRPLDEWEFLDHLSALGPVRWADRAGGQRFVLAGLRSGAEPPPEAHLVELSPRRHYDGVLTGLSRELAWMFLAGFGAMAIYLAFLQRSIARVVYVFAPLFPAALAFAVYARLTGGTANIVHFMAFALVIALALDYTAVAVSTNHGSVELSKVLLTGLATLATFGVLVLARHPVMRDLGATVALGCSVSLAFALFVRLPPRDEGRA
jgi:hypothetical protein